MEKGTTREKLVGHSPYAKKEGKRVFSLFCLRVACLPLWGRERASVVVVLAVVTRIVECKVFITEEEEKAAT